MTLGNRGNKDFSVIAFNNKKTFSGTSKRICQNSHFTPDSRKLGTQQRNIKDMQSEVKFH